MSQPSPALLWEPNIQIFPFELRKAKKISGTIHSSFFIHQAMGSCLVCGWCGAWPCWGYWGVWCVAVAALGMYTLLYLSDWPQPQKCTPRHGGRLLQPWPQPARLLYCLSLPFKVTAPFVKWRVYLLNWSIADLQYCVSFRSTAKWFSYIFYCCLVAKSCPTLSDPMNCRMPGSTVHRIAQARVLEWVTISFSRGSSWSRDWTNVSCVTGRFFTTEPPGKP